MRVMSEESFGPVVGIMRVVDDEEAVRRMNDSAFGLTASVWTRDASAALALGERVLTPPDALEWSSKLSHRTSLPAKHARKKS